MLTLNKESGDIQINMSSSSPIQLTPLNANANSGSRFWEIVPNITMTYSSSHVESSSDTIKTQYCDYNPTVSSSASEIVYSKSTRSLGLNSSYSWPFKTYSSQTASYASGAVSGHQYRLTSSFTAYYLSTSSHRSSSIKFTIGMGGSPGRPASIDYAIGFRSSSVTVSSIRSFTLAGISSPYYVERISVNATSSDNEHWVYSTSPDLGSSGACTYFMPNGAVGVSQTDSFGSGSPTDLISLHDLS